MNVLIVGLGLMGGSYALALSNKGYNVYGIDKNINAINYAKKHNMIIEGFKEDEASSLIMSSDLIILCIYPDQILDFIKRNNKYFNKNQIITFLFFEVY